MVYTGATITPHEIVFTSDSWSEPQRIDVSASFDNLEEGLHFDSVKHEIVTTDIDYLNRKIESVTIEVRFYIQTYTYT